jgi:hypothetical protein
MKKNLLVFAVLIFAVSASAFSENYWHNLTGDIGSNAVYGISGDSSNLYVIHSSLQKTFAEKSSDMGKTWERVYQKTGMHINDYPFEDLTATQYIGNGKMFLMYSNTDESYGDRGIGILKMNVDTGERLDSVVLSRKYGYAEQHDFIMYDSLYGVLVSSGLMWITRDGWQSFDFYNLYDGEFNKDSTEYYADFQCIMNAIHIIGKDTIFFDGYQYNEYLQNRDSVRGDYQIMFINPNDKSITYEKLTDGINIQITPDSIHRVIRNSEWRLRPRNIAYLNDSTWLFLSNGRKTGYGNCKTLEIFKTSNRGKIFRQVCNMDPDEFGLHRIAFKDEMNGIATGNGVILLTSDGGETWELNTVSNLYEKNWEQETSYLFNLFPSYIDDMTFLGCFGTGVYKLEEEFGVGVSESNLQTTSSLIYPNPAAPGEKINFNSPGRIFGEARIYDLKGNLVFQTPVSDNSILLKPGMLRGTYLLAVRSRGEIVFRSMFVVE